MATVAGGALQTARNPAETLGRIRAAAAQEFGANGFSGASVQRIAREAQVSKQIIYHYFGSKTELYKDILRDLSRVGLDHLLGNPDEAPEPLTVIQTFLEELFDMYQGQATMAALTFDQMIQLGSHVTYHRDVRQKHQVLVDRLSAAIRAGQAQGTVSPKIGTGDFEFMAVLITSACATSRNSLARIIDIPDIPHDDTGFWKDYAVSFVMRAIRP